MKSETCRADVTTDGEVPGWSLRIFESTWPGLVGSRWRAELVNPEARVVFAPHLQSSFETVAEAIVTHLSDLGLRHTGKVLAEMARNEIKFSNT